MADITFKDFQDLDKITAVVCYPTPSLVVKHILSLKRKVPQKLGNTMRTEERGSVFYYSLNGVEGLYLESRGTILLEGHRSSPSGEGAYNYKKICCYLDGKDSGAFLQRLDVALSWLTGEQNKEIYLADSQGRPYKLLDSSKKIVASLSQSTYIGFKPCIIRDMNDVTYEGIAMGNEQGEITNFTASEFSSFRIVMHSLLPNLYLANSMLFNNAVQLGIYSKLQSFGKKE
jgi:hypothetical protein